MSADQYSAGPWSISAAPSRKSMTAIRAPGGEVVAFVNRRPNAEANAQLLRAAPTMLAALSRVAVEWLLADDDPVAVAVLAAIAEAKGHS